MNKKECILMLVLALVAGLVGGVMSSQLLTAQPAFAKRGTMMQKEVVAEKFI